MNFACISVWFGDEPLHSKAWSPSSCNGRKHRCKHVSDSVPSSFDTGLVSITRQMPRPRHKNKAIIRLSSHPSR